MPSWPAFLGPAYRSASYMADAERCVNWFLEANESAGAETKHVMLPTPGIETFCGIAASPMRGGYTCQTVTGERPFVVCGDRLYELTNVVYGSDGQAISCSAVERGAMGFSATALATFAWNGDAGNQLLVADGTGDAYSLDLGTLAFNKELTGTATMVAYLSSRGLALDSSTGTLRISDLDDFTTWDPTQVVQNSATADPWVAMSVVHNEIWLFGTQTSQVWGDTGAFPFPFAPLPGALIEQGISAPFSWGHAGTPLAWMGRSDQGFTTVWRANGWQAERISTSAIEQAIGSYPVISDAVGWYYGQDGHYFFLLMFPTAGKTWVYDALTSLWHERAYWNRTTGEWEAYRVWCGFVAFGRNLCGDRAAGTIYRLDTTLAVDVDGLGTRRERQAPRLAQDQNRVRYESLQLVMDVGIGNRIDPGADPQVMLSTSCDGGQTFGPERWTSAGKLGAYGTRVRWTRLGQARNFVFKVVVSDPVLWRITDAVLTATPGTA